MAVVGAVVEVRDVDVVAVVDVVEAREERDGRTNVVRGKVKDGHHVSPDLTVKKEL